MTHSLFTIGGQGWLDTCLTPGGQLVPQGVDDVQRHDNPDDVGDDDQCDLLQGGVALTVLPARAELAEHEEVEHCLPEGHHADGEGRGGGVAGLGVVLEGGK